MFSLKVSPVHRVNLQSQWQRNILICVKSNSLRQELAAEDGQPALVIHVSVAVLSVSH